MIKKLLIANRGEIALRIMRACKEMGIKTVAIYSEADENAPHTNFADEKHYIGPSPVQQSYLKSDTILTIAKQANVDAIHPGYGLLSENGIFAEQCQEAGFIFIGPNAEVIDQMGDKITARKIMQKAGVPVIPGSEKAVTSFTEAKEVAHHLGYPIMIKASAGGGGVGLEIVQKEADLQTALENTIKRAESLFENGSIFIEKLIENARHVEVQILADGKGNAIHLYERECSIQRRNQKVIEEAPCSNLSEHTRANIVETALQAIHSLDYTNAGTIEFLVDSEERFYFLEMNTRIQVEHAITEEITGIDIVKEQINIAKGAGLSYTQDDIQMKGHAIEARIYAEDPNTLFPSPGFIEVYEEPKGVNVRVESSVRAHMNVTPFYDPMISKLIVSALTREKAIDNLEKALKTYQVEGIKTNIPLLLDIITTDQFKTGNVSTHFLENWMKE